jgi:ribosome modulation factor
MGSIEILTAEYEQGSDAYSAGKPDSECPYPPKQGNGAQRISWFNGWLDARTQDKLGHIFEKYGLTK